MALKNCPCCGVDLSQFDSGVAEDAGLPVLMERIRAWLDAPDQKQQAEFTSLDVAMRCLGLAAERVSPQVMSAIVQALTGLGFVRRRPRRTVNGKRSSYVFCRPEWSSGHVVVNVQTADRMTTKNSAISDGYDRFSADGQAVK